MPNPSQKRQVDKEKLKNDPFYIPSVPMYRVLGEELDDTLGDRFFDLCPNSFQRSPPPEFYSKGKEVEAGMSKIVIGEGHGEVKLRRTKSLIKPGRPSVANRLSKVEVKPLPAVIEKSTPPSKARVSIQQQPVKNVFATKTKTKATPPPPLQSVISNAASTQLRSSAKKEVRTPETKEPMKQTSSAKKCTPEKDQSINVKPLPLRRSRSLVKPGRPSVASREVGPSQPSKVEPSTMQKASNGAVPNVKSSTTLSKQPVARDIFATKKTMPPPAQPASKVLMQLRSNAKPVVSTPQSISSTPSAQVGKPSTSSRTQTSSRLSSYMAPTISSSARRNQVSSKK